MNIEKLNAVPHQPGVYLWKNSYGTIIYVGKAKDLNNRMKQYFRGMLNSYKTAKMVESIADFEYIITSSDKEALILERNLIEQYSPEFNILLTDDKRYPYIKVKQRKDGLDINLVYRVKQERDKAIYYGPFPTGYGARKMANLVSRLTTYKDGLPYRSGDSQYWKGQYDYAKKLLTTSVKSLIKELETKMLSAAERMQFEIAAEIKETLVALEALDSNQGVEFMSSENVDVMAFVEKDNYLSIATLFYRQGILLSKQENVIEIATSKEEAISQYVSQFYGFNIIPDYIISNEAIESDIKIVNPSKGDKKHILDIALTNAQDNIELKLQKFIRKEELTIGAMKKLESILGLKNIAHILMIDNSNTNNTDPVSAIVSYRNGIKQRNEYRKYNLVLNERLADVDYMLQGVKKHFENEANPIPDLFIVDGGIAQINEVKKYLQDKVNIIGLVKNDKHTTDHLIDLQGNKREIEDKNLLNFLRGMQEEVDRYAKSQHTRRRMTTLEGILITVDGIGHSTEEKLLTHFGSYANIYNATEEELSKVVSPKLAQKIKEAFKGR